MNRELAYQCALAFMVVVVIGLVVIMWREHPAPQVLVDAQPTALCQPALPNPCDRVNCNRVNTKVIA
jgi:hypothetical protein